MYLVRVHEHKLLVYNYTCKFSIVTTHYVFYCNLCKLCIVNYSCKTQISMDMQCTTGTRRVCTVMYSTVVVGVIAIQIQIVMVFNSCAYSATHVDRGHCNRLSKFETNREFDFILFCDDVPLEKNCLIYSFGCTTHY